MNVYEKPRPGEKIKKFKWFYSFIWFQEQKKNL